MCDVLKPIFKQTILPDDVVRLIAEFASVEERFNVKQLLPLYFNFNYNKREHFNDKDNEECEWCEFEVCRMMVFNSFNKPHNPVKLASLKRKWDRNYLYKGVVNDDYLFYIRYAEPHYNGFEATISHILREMLCYEKTPRGVIVCKNRFDKMKWYKFELLMGMLYYWRRDFYEEN